MGPIHFYSLRSVFHIPHKRTMSINQLINQPIMQFSSLPIIASGFSYSYSSQRALPVEKIMGHMVFYGSHAIPAEGTYIYAVQISLEFQHSFFNVLSLTSWCPNIGSVNILFIQRILKTCKQQQYKKK